ncbi:MAG: aminomethyltransferase beta-barrel domain-containing protein [Bacillota bacterium]
MPSLKGQAVLLYDDDIVIGGGTIPEFYLFDYPICLAV